jgi:hypothetical protein
MESKWKQIIMCMLIRDRPVFFQFFLFVMYMYERKYSLLAGGIKEKEKTDEFCVLKSFKVVHLLSCII